MAVHQKEDHSLNDINRDLIKAMDGYYGQVYVGSINGDLVLAQYNGEKIYNFYMACEMLCRRSCKAEL